jgi:hypothetical protein
MKRTIERTIDLDYTGQNFLEGPVDLEGAELASAEARADLSRGSSAWSSGEIELRGVAPGSLRPVAFAVAQTLTPAAPSRRGAGDATEGVAADSRLDGVVTTAQSGVKLRVLITLNDRRKET